MNGFLISFGYRWPRDATGLIKDDCALSLILYSGFIYGTFGLRHIHVPPFPAPSSDNALAPRVS